MTKGTIRYAIVILSLLASGVLIAGKPNPGKSSKTTKSAAPAKAAMVVSPATITKPTVQLHSKPDFNAAVVTSLTQNTQVKVTGQEGLWFLLSTADGKSGYVRVNDVRMIATNQSTESVGKALFTGAAGKGRVTETASVRGLDESTLKAASFNQAQLQLLESYRATPEAAEQAAAEKALEQLV